MNDGKEQSARQRYQQEQMRRRKMRVRFFTASFVAILLLSGVITFLIELPSMITTPKAPASGSTAQPPSNSAQAPAQDGSGALPAVTGALGPAVQEGLTYAKPSTAMLSLAANGRVDMEYFSDALFIGDSLTQGFELFSKTSGISNAKYAAYIGVGPKELMGGAVTNMQGQVVTAIDEILAAAPKKVYILLGTNALPTLTDEAFLKYYNDFLVFLLPQLPADTVYYLQGIPPVTTAKAQGDAKYANTRIAALNEEIAAMAYAYGLHYLHLPQVLADETGALRPDIVSGSDGIHLSGAGYDAWKEYLVTHTAYNQNSPYIAGSPYLRA